MKRIAKMAIIMLLVLLMSPLAASAAPQGYMEVNLTKKNFKKYFTIKKVKLRDAFGDYDGYRITLSSKMLKKGYYIIGTKNFAIKGTVKVREKYKEKKKTYKNSGTIKIKDSSPFVWITSSPDKYNYKYAKASNFKIKKVKGTIIFADPTNVIGVEKHFSSTDHNTLSYVTIKLRYPYEPFTSEESHYDEAKDEWVVDYYYVSNCDTAGNQLLG